MALARVRTALGAAIAAYRSYEMPETPETLHDRYARRWAYVDGSAFNAAWRRRGVFRDQRVYKATRLIFKHTSAITTFYEATTYQGNLPTDGLRLPDGSRGAIPLDPQTGDKATDAALLAAIAEHWNRWNWQQGMTLRPRYGSALGDVLTELVDDPGRHSVHPDLVWPGHVVDLALDAVGNVKAHTLEYMITRVEDGREVTFRFRKEVDGKFFRYYRDDNPWSDPEGHGDWEQENPYGFDPAIWDRHKVVWDAQTGALSVRGAPAMEDTRQALNELNSMLSHAMDYQAKQFAAPIFVRGGTGGAQMPAADRERLGIYEVGENGGADILQFDVGKTLELLQWIKEGILEENPEASFYHDLREMSSLTGPAVERALGDAVSRVNLARAGYDANSVKLFQMATAIAGYRLNNGDWANPTKRDAVFAPFGLDSYKAGQLDLTILGRPVVPQTAEDQLQLVERRERLIFRDSLIALGHTETEADALIAEREKTLLRRADFA